MGVDPGPAGHRMPLMYNSVSACLEYWEAERASTLKVMRALTDPSLSQQVNAKGRCLGYLAWHLVLTLGEMCGKAGLPVDSPDEDAAEPESAEELASAYEAASASVSDVVRSRWTDAMLADELKLYGGTWTRGGVLASLVNHQIHHRGQMTVRMRQAGRAVPGVCGPAREEQAAMGLPPMK